MGIAEFLDAADGAVLVAINGGVELVTTQHDSPTRLIIERFPLGPVVDVDELLARLGAQGRLPAVPVAPAPAQAMLAAPAADLPFVCPECGKAYSKRTGLGNHRRSKHGVPGAHPRSMAGEFECSLCLRSFGTAHGFEVHLGRSHRDRPAPPVPAPVTPQSLEPPPPLAVDGAPRRLAQDAPTPPVAADPRGTCDACGMPNRDHLGCEECGRRIGPGHTVTAPAKQQRGKVWCADCLELLRLKARYAGKAA